MHLQGNPSVEPCCTAYLPISVPWDHLPTIVSLCPWARYYTYPAFLPHIQFATLLTARTLPVGLLILLPVL